MDKVTYLDRNGERWTTTDTGTLQGESGEAYTRAFLDSRVGPLCLEIPPAEYYRGWESPNGVTHTVNRRTGCCLTCGHFHEVTK